MGVVISDLHKHTTMNESRTLFRALVFLLSMMLLSLSSSGQTNFDRFPNSPSLIACGSPTSLTVTGITTSSANLGWSGVSGATSYLLQYKASSATNWTSVTTTSTAKNVTGLSSSTTYQFNVQATCGIGTGTISATQTFTTLSPCQSPSGLSASQITTSSAKLNWTAITGIMYFNFRYRVSGSSTWTNDSSITNYKTISGLSPATTYQYQVQTRCSAGLLSTYTSSSTFTTLASASCGTATGLTATSVSTSGATLNWTTVSGASSYTIQYRISGSSTWTSTTSTTGTTTISGLYASTLYEFQVQTVCSGTTSAFTASANFTTLAQACSVPNVALFSSTNITASTCTVGWAAVSGAVSYNVQYRVSGSGSAWTNQASSTNTSNLTSLNPSTLYEFQVQTVCSGSSSAFSSSGIFTTLANPCTVPDVALFSSTTITSSSCTVGWAAVANALSYNVQYRVRNSGSSFTTVAATTNSKSLTGLSPSTLYEFQVQTVCSGGNSAYSSVGIFTTLSGASCGMASGLSATGITTTGATLNWTAVSGAASYSIQYRKIGTSTWSTATSTTNSKAITGLTIGSSYEFQVQTVCSGATSAFTASATFSTTGTGVSLPVPDHIVICIMENHAYQQIIGNTAAPHINALANDVMSANFTQSYGIEHPSQPNYLDFFAGGNQGITNNNLPPSHFTSMNLAKALLTAGRTFVTYSEDLPSAGWDGEVSGGYARKHNPVANWMGTGTNQVSSSLNQPYTAFPTNYANLPTVSYVVPNLINGMHDGSGNTAITTGDNWYYTNMYPYVQWARTHNSLFILTFDEDDNISGNRIPTIFSGQMVSQGQFATSINHYNVLRTIEDMYGLTHSGAAATAAPIHGCWTNGYRIGSTTDETAFMNWEVFPNPFSDIASISFEAISSSQVKFRVHTLLGQTVFESTTMDYQAGMHQVDLPLSDPSIRKGIYFVEMMLNDRIYIKKIIKTTEN